jgi:hypothetical protein
MARGETGRCCKAQENDYPTEPATEGPAKTFPSADTTDSEERPGGCITQSSRYSGARPETNAAQPGETYGKSWRTSADCQIYSGWFAYSAGCGQETRSSESGRSKTGRHTRRVAGSETPWYAGPSSDSGRIAQSRKTNSPKPCRSKDIACASDQAGCNPDL